MSLMDLANSLLDVERQTKSRPLDYFNWLPCQVEFFKATERVACMRAGNQALGKTTALVSDLLWLMAGEHPYRECKKPPVKCLFVTASHEQGLNIMQKIWALADHSWFAEGTEFCQKKAGFTGKYPRVVFANGSSVVFRSGMGAALNLAGLVCDAVYIDEPPVSSRIYSESLKRLLKAGNQGTMRMAFTPVNADVRWLKELCEAGSIADYHTPLTPEALVPVGTNTPLKLSDGTVCDEAWIQSVIAESLPHEVPVICHGEWEFRATDGLFEKWSPSEMVTPKMPAGDVPVYIGIDHGSGKAGSSVAIIVAVEKAPDLADSKVYVLSEYVSSAECTEDHDAAGILEAIERVPGLKWSDLDQAWGDRPHHGARGSVSKKSNGLLAAALGKAERAAVHNIRPGVIHPPLRNAKRGKHGPNTAGAVSFGCTWLHRCMLKGNFSVHPRCTNLIACLSQYEGKSNSPSSHSIDALRYALRSIIYSPVNRSTARARVSFR